MCASFNHPLDPLVEVMARLRREDGCPWDIEQDHHTLKPYLIEEAYEVLDAIDAQDDESLVEELGDVLLQVVFHSQIASETGRFDINDVIERITEKLIRRHPHVFDKAHAPDARAVSAQWEEIKRLEKKEKGEKAPSLLDGVSHNQPALMVAFELQKRAAKVGFDWDDAKGAVEKATEEVEEIKRAVEKGEAIQAEKEWGDLFFALVNAARHAGVQPELALRSANQKFERRFRHIEEQARQSGRALKEMSLQEMDVLWERAKKGERPSARPSP